MLLGVRMLVDTYEVIKVMNNNVVLAKDMQQGQECILIGKGLGFGKQAGGLYSVPAHLIEKRFITFEQSVKKQYFELITGMDPKIVGLCAEVTALAESRLGTLNPQIHVVLTDHIGFAIQRIQQGMEIHNPFLYEIQMLYPEEYEMAAAGVHYLGEQLGITIPVDETGFVALHFHAARQNEAVKETVKQTRLLKELIKLIEGQLGRDFVPTELTYQRLVNHLRGLVDRVRKGTTIENPLFENIRREFSESFAIAVMLKGHMEKAYEMKVPDNELGYMALHIERIRKSKN